eukprot:XP_025001488.1 geranylgeranyl transferase type-2 subunit alpha [Gallus gallus]
MALSICHAISHNTPGNVPVRMREMLPLASLYPTTPLARYHCARGKWRPPHPIAALLRYKMAAPTRGAVSHNAPRPPPSPSRPHPGVPRGTVDCRPLSALRSAVAMHGRLKVRPPDAARRRQREEKLRLFRANMAALLEKAGRCQDDAELLTLTGAVLEANPDVGTAWNVRRAALLRRGGDWVSEELSFVGRCLGVNPKSYGAWHHRGWVLRAHPDPSAERGLCERLLEADPRNCEIGGGFGGIWGEMGGLGGSLRGLGGSLRGLGAIRGDMGGLGGSLRRLEGEI